MKTFTNGQNVIVEGRIAGIWLNADNSTGIRIRTRSGKFIDVKELDVDEAKQAK